MNLPLPWLSEDNPIRVGASRPFNQPVILEYRNNVWKFQPRQQVTDDGADVATFEDTRDDQPRSASRCPVTSSSRRSTS